VRFPHPESDAVEKQAGKHDSVFYGHAAICLHQPGAMDNAQNSREMDQAVQATSILPSQPTDQPCSRSQRQRDDEDKGEKPTAMKGMLDKCHSTFREHLSSHI